MPEALDQFIRSQPEATLSVSDTGDKPKFVGWAHRYGVLSAPMTVGNKTFRERFMPGAFRRAITSTTSDLRALVNHEKGQVLGRQSAGTLKITESNEGVYFEVDPPDTAYARDLIEQVRRKDVTGCSFRFCGPISQKFERSAQGETVRTITEAGIKEVSIVTWPAYEDGSSVELRDLDPDAIAQLHALEHRPHLRAATLRNRFAAIA